MLSDHPSKVSSSNHGGSSEYGRRLVPNVIDEAAHETPEREAFSIPRSTNPGDGWRVVTFKDYANAINRCCHMIVERCGKAPEGTFPTIAYIGPNDARYYVLLLAAVKTGYQAFFISPRNSFEAQMNLFKEIDCRFLAYPGSHRAMVSPWLHAREMKGIEIGSVEEWFCSAKVPPHPYGKTFEQARWEPFVVLHTSGSTGLPKPIVCRQGSVALGDAQHLLPLWEGYKPTFRGWSEAGRIFSPMPMYHAAGIYLFAFMAIYWDTPLVLGFPEKQLSAELVTNCLSNMEVGATVMPPSILEDISQQESGLRLLAKLRFVTFGGGPLAPESGERLRKGGVFLQNVIAATETAPFPLYWNPDGEQWPYFIYNDEQLGCEWRKVEGERDVYEQVIVRKEKDPGLQSCFYTFPELDEYSTKDLYQPHPDLPHHWRHVGRADNIIVFSNGEKLNPTTIEKTIEDDPRVKGALVVGSGRFEPALIVEPVLYPKNVEGEESFLDSIWPKVLLANNDSVAHGKISRPLIGISNPSKPFLRAGKGTVQRAGTVKLYGEEIEQIYNHSEQTKLSQLPPLDVSSEDGLAKSIQILFESQLESTNLELDTDYFSAGVDSLQIIQISRLLRASLVAAGYTEHAAILNPRIVNGHPTIQKLARFVIQKIVRGETITTDTADEILQQQQEAEALYKKYAADLSGAKGQRPEADDEEQTILLTGSTGMLGSYMLEMLARSPKVKRIVCLNRAEDGGAKQQARSANDRDLDGTYGGKAEFHHIDASLPELGLPSALYTRLLKETDRVIHNAWPVNFHMPVASFEAHLRGVRNLTEFASKAAKRIAVVFVGSIGTIIGWDRRIGSVPEERFDDFGLAGGGYGQSKMVGSLILEAASKAGDFPATSVRVGQIAGPEAGRGVWNRHEWLPSIIASSLYLKALPADLGRSNRIDWTPVERVANMILEIVGATQKVMPETISGYYHGVNPSTTDWSVLASAVRDFYGDERLPESISFSDWVARLENTQPADGNPGLKLLDTYRSMAVEDQSIGQDDLIVSMTRTMGQSPTIRTSRAVTAELMKQWCSIWNF